MSTTALSQENTDLHTQALQYEAEQEAMDAALDEAINEVIYEIRHRDRAKKAKRTKAGDDAKTEFQLIEEAKAGNTEALDILLERYQPLFLSMAHRYECEEADEKDYLSLGKVVLVKALRKFDPRKAKKDKGSLGAFLKLKVRVAFREAMREAKSPVHVHAKIPACIKCRLEYKEETVKSIGREPTEEEYQARCNGCPQNLATLDKALLEDVSYDEPPSTGDKDGEGVPLSEMISDRTALSPADALIAKEDRRILAHELFTTLDELEQIVIGGHFGFNGQGKSTFEDIARNLGTSDRTIRRIYHGAIEKLRELVMQLGEDGVCNEADSKPKVLLPAFQTARPLNGRDIKFTAFALRLIAKSEANNTQLARKKAAAEAKAAPLAKDKEEFRKAIEVTRKLMVKTLETKVPVKTEPTSRKEDSREEAIVSINGQFRPDILKDVNPVDQSITDLDEQLPELKKERKKPAQTVAQAVDWDALGPKET